MKSRDQWLGNRICYLIKNSVWLWLKSPSDQKNYERLATLGSIMAQLKVPLKPSEHHGTMVSRGLSGAPIMPRGVSLSDSRGKFFQSGPRAGEMMPPATTRFWTGNCDHGQLTHFHWCFGMNSWNNSREHTLWKCVNLQGLQWVLFGAKFPSYYAGKLDVS